MPGKLIGRDRQLAAVQDALDQTRSGSARLIEFVGDPGVGKSRLLRATVELAEQQGYRALVASLDQVDRRVPFAALRLAILPALEEERSPRTHEAVQALHAALRFGNDRGASSPEIVTLLAKLLAEWTDRGPVILAIDDVQFCDTDTLDALTFCGRHLKSRPLLVAVTTNPDITEHSAISASRLHKIRDAGKSCKITVPPLSGDDLAAYVSELIGGCVTDELCDHIATSTGGTPFYISLLVESLAHSGKLSELTPGLIDVVEPAGAALAAPAMVVHRVLRLGRDASQIARAVAASGPVAISDLGLLATATGLDQRQANSGFDALVRAKVLTADGSTFRFTHPIVRSVLYADLGPAEARQIHIHIARELVARRGAGIPVDIITLARHASAAGAVGERWAIDALVEAGDLVIRQAPHNAIGWYQDAIELSTDDEESACLHIRLARASSLAGRRTDSVKAAAIAKSRLGFGRDRMDATSIGIRVLANDGRFDEADRWYRETDPDEARLAPRLHAHYAQSLLWRDLLDEAATVLTRAQELLDPDHDPVVDMVTLLHSLATNQPGRAREIAAAMTQALPSMSPLTRQSTELGLATALAYYGAPSHAGEYFALHDTSAAKHGIFACGLMFMYWQLGAWDDALALYERIDTAHPSDRDLALTSTIQGLVAMIGAERGSRCDPETRVELLNAKTVSSWAAVGAAWSDVAGGDLDSARALLQQNIAYVLSVGRVGTVATPMALLAEIEVDAGHIGRAQELSVELDTYTPADAYERPACLAHLTRALAFGDVGAAVRAGDIAERAGMLLELARSLELRGALGDDADLLLEAHRLYTRLGAVRRKQRAARELRRLGRRAPRKHCGGGLSETEMRLVELVADGLTNRQIGEVVHLSPKTIENYLSRIFSKTRCAGRVELAVAYSDGRFDLVEADANSR